VTGGFFISNFEGVCTFFEYKTVRGHITKLHGGLYFSPPIWGAFTYFFTTRLHGATTLMMAAIFVVETDPFR